MKEITIKAYNVEDAKNGNAPFTMGELAAKYSDINTDDCKWWDHIYDNLSDFIKLCDGSEGIDTKKIHFRLGRGKFLSFEWQLHLQDLKTLLGGKLADEWESSDDFQEMYSGWQKLYAAIPDRMKSLDIDCCCGISHGNRTEKIESEMDWKVCEKRHPNFHGGLFLAMKLCEKIVTDISYFWLNVLSKSYDYLTSDGAIIETLEANEYWFNEDMDIV